MTMKLSLCLLAFWAVSAHGEVPPDTGLIQPRTAVEKAAAAAPAGVFGTFDVHVLSTGNENGKVFLNSESDYRDQRDLTVELVPSVAHDLEKIYGAPPETFFRDKHIAVTGQALRVTVWFFDSDGHQSDKYYYQTHVLVATPNQIRILP
jgi:hypothetical protein